MDSTTLAGVSPFEVNPGCRLRTEPLYDGHVAVIVDDFLLRPDLVRAYARIHRAAFDLHPDDHYPGPELRLPEEAWAPVLRWWRQVGRLPFRASRATRLVHGRLSLVTLPPERLSLGQRLCHTDGPPPQGGDGPVKYAGVLYLFSDPALGGTAFYSAEPGLDRPTLFRAAREEGEVALAERYSFFRRPRGYLVDSCEFYQLRHVVAPAYNRVVFYRGDVPHTGHIRHPERLSEDIRSGRLTANFFITAAGHSS